MTIFITLVIVLMLIILIGTAVAISNFDKNMKFPFSKPEEIKGEYTDEIQPDDHRHF